jgi:DNA adenine methylase
MLKLKSKPLFMWAGGKTKMVKHYEPIMPSPLYGNVSSYVEPFFGGGAMFIYMRTLYNLKRVVINDINEDIMNIYRSIQSYFDEFMRRLVELDEMYIGLSYEDRKSYYYAIRNKHAFEYERWSKPVESATLYFLLKTGFNGIYQINHNTNGRYGTPAGLLNQKQSVYDAGVVKWWNDALQGVEICSESWADVPYIPEALYFVDPPYRDSFADYHNGFGDAELIRLLDFFRTHDGVMITNRDDDGWFDKHSVGYQTKHFPVTYTAGRRKKEGDEYKAKKAREILLYRISDLG